VDVCVGARVDGSDGGHTLAYNQMSSRICGPSPRGCIVLSKEHVVFVHDVWMAQKCLLALGIL
jgi:hypothetical protein